MRKSGFCSDSVFRTFGGLVPGWGTHTLGRLSEQGEEVSLSYF